MIKLRAVLEMFTKGTDKAKKEVGQINDRLDQAADNAARMNKTLSQTKTGRGAMSRAGVQDTRDYRTQRSVTGSRGAEGRNFAGLARGGGGTGIVAAYAEVASTLFAVTAAFQALSNAAKVDQITKGLQILGAASGVTLSNVARGLQEVTGYGITAADAMRTVALGSSAGLNKKEIEDLGKIAKGASIALGRDLGDSMDRLIKGTVKLEPELLDELGIMVRLDDAVNEYALANNKTASSLTQLEKRQAFANAVSAEGIKKFGELAENSDPNPYDKLAASVKELGTDILSFVNNGLKPFIGLLADVPALALLPFTYLLQTVSAKLLPTFDSAMGKAGATSEIYARKLTMIRDRSDEITGSMTAANNSLVAQGKAFSNLKAQPGMANRKSEIIGPGLVSPGLSGITEKQLIRAIDEEILSIKQKLITAEGAHTTKLTGQRDTLVSIKQKLMEIKNEHKELLRIRNQEIAAQARLNAQTAQQGILTEFNSNVFSKGLIGATLTGLGDIYRDILVPGMKDSNKVSKTLNGTLTGTAIKLKTVGIAAVTAGRLIGMAFLQAIPIIGQLVMVGTIIFSIFAAFESEASKQKKKLLENLKNINDNAKEVEKQVDRAFENRDYGAGFQAAITSLGEIVAALKEIQELRDLPQGVEGEFLSKDVISSGKRAFASIFDPKSYDLKDLAMASISFGTLAVNRGLEESAKGIAKTKEEADALNISIARIADVKGPEYAQKVREMLNDAGEDYLPILERENDSVKALASSWSAVGEEASNVSKTLKKLYGKPITETDYTPVVNSLINIQRETNAVTAAFQEAGVDSTVALTGIYDELSKGGTELAAELDRVNKDTSYSFLKTFNEIDALDRKIRSMQAAKAPAADIQAQIDSRNQLADEAARRAADGELVTKLKIKDTEQLVLDRKKAILDLTKKQNDLEKSIAQKVFDIAKNNRDIQRLRTLGTTEVSPALALQDELSDAREKARIESIGLKVRAQLIALEFELESLKLDNAQRTLESQANAISAFNNGANKVGTEIASEIFKGLGKDKSFENFAKAMKSQTFLDSSRPDEEGLATIIDFSPEQINSLWDYVNGVNYTTKSKKALAKVSALQNTLNGLEVQSNESAIDVVQEKINAYNNQFNVRQREIEQNKKALDQADELISKARQIEDLNTTARIFELKTQRATKGLGLSTTEVAQFEIDEKNVALDRLREDLESLKARNKIAEDSARLALDKAQEQLFTAADNPETEAGTLAQLHKAFSDANNDLANTVAQNTQSTADMNAEINTATAELGYLNATIPSLAATIRDAKMAASNNLGIERAGFGVSLFGGGDIFRSLVEQAGETTEGGVQAVLGDPEKLATIRASVGAIRQMNDEAKLLSDLSSTVNSGFDSIFLAAEQGSKAMGEAFKDMAQQILRQIALMTIKMLAFKAIEMGLNLIPGVGPGLSAGFRSLTGAAPISGTVTDTAVSAGSNMAPGALHSVPGIANGGIIALANGGIMDASGGLQGIVSKPTYLVGEGRYNEAVVPLPNGKSIPVQMHGGGSQSNNVSVNVNMTNNGSQTQTEGQDPAKLGQAIAAAVQRELVAQKAPGGLLNKYSAI